MAQIMFHGPPAAMAGPTAICRFSPRLCAYRDAGSRHVESGEPFEQLFAESGNAQLLYMDTKRQHAKLPSEDLSHMTVDGFPLMRAGMPMKNCRGH